MKSLLLVSLALLLAVLSACHRHRPREAPDAETIARSPLAFPSAQLTSARVQSSRLGGEWKTVDLETATNLVSALSENHRYFAPDNVVCVRFTPPKWAFFLTWSDGTSMLVRLSADGGMIHESRREHGGADDRKNYGTYVVDSKRVKDILERCPYVEEFTREACAVCGMEVMSNTQNSAGRGAKVFYFCSEAHLDQFEKSPESYENGAKSSQGEEHR